MGKQIRFTFEKGGILIADLLEDVAPITCNVIWNALENPWTELMNHSKISGAQIETPYLPVPETLKLPNENLWHFSKCGDVATISPFEYREMSIKGYLPLIIVYGSPDRYIPTIAHLQGNSIDRHYDGDSIRQLYKKSMLETCRANVFARVIKKDIKTVVEIGWRLRFYGLEGFTVERE